MARSVLANGAGESLGDILVTCKPLIISGAMWFVHSGDGVDAGGTAGQDREKPLATLAQAVTNASTDDIICLMDGHQETLTGLLTVSKRLTIVGGGQSNGKPTVKLQGKAADIGVLSFTVAGCELRNVWLLASATANGHSRITVSGANFRLTGCYVECGQYDLATALELASGADRARLATSTFISTAITTAAQPESAIKTSAAISDLELESLTILGGQVGFSNVWALDASLYAVTRLRGRSLYTTNGDAKFNGSSTGWLDWYITSEGADF